MSDNPLTDRRDRPERRLHDLPIWHPRRLHGRRAGKRRGDESGKPYLVERVSGPVFLLASLLLVLTLIDGISVDDIARSAQEFFDPDQMTVVSLGPKEPI